MAEEIRNNQYVRRLYTALAHGLRTSYHIAQSCSPLANHSGFDVKHSENHWKLLRAGEEAGIM